MKVKCCECKRDITEEAKRENMNLKDPAVRVSLMCIDCAEMGQQEIADTVCSEEEMQAPHGRCEKCNAPLRMERYGDDADGNRGIWIYMCTNPECEEGE